MSGEFWVVRTDYQKNNAIKALADIVPNQETPMAVKVEEYKPKRSELQNRFLWGWIYKHLADSLESAGIVIHCDDGTEHPYTKDVLHEIFKIKYLGKASFEAKGKSLTLYYSSTELGKKQLVQSCDKQEHRIPGLCVIQTICSVWTVSLHRRPPVLQLPMRSTALPKF